MTMYPTDPGLQPAFIADLFNRLNSLRNQVTGITLAQDTEPTHNEWEAQWVAEGYSLPITPGAELYWWDSARHKLRGVYMTLESDIPKQLFPAYSQYAGGSSMDNYVSSVDIFQDGKTFLITGSWFDEKVPAAYLVDRDGNWTIIPNTADAYHASLNDDDTQLVYVNAAQTDIITLNVDGTGSSTILAGRTSIQCAYWYGSYIVFIDSTGLNIMTSAGAGLTLLSATVYQALYHTPTLNSIDSKVYYNKNATDIYSINTDGTGDALVFSDGDEIFLTDIDENQQYLYCIRYFPQILREAWGGGWKYYVNFSRMTVAGTDLEEMPNEALTWAVEQKLNIADIFTYPTLGYDLYGDGLSNYLELTEHLRSNPSYPHFNGVRLYWKSSPQFFINWAGIIQLTAGFGSHLTMAANQFENESSGFIHRITNYTPAVHDIELIWSREWDTQYIATPIEIQNISQDYKHLLVFWQLESDYNALRDSLVVSFNGDSAVANYDSLSIRNNTGWAKTEDIGATYGGTNVTIKGRSANATWPSSGMMLIPNYRDDYHYKQLLHITTNPQAALGETNFGFGLWENTAAITSMSWTLVNATRFYPHGKAYVEVYGLSGDIEFYGE